MTRKRHVLQVCLLSLSCLLCGYLVLLLLWRLVDIEDSVWAYLTFLATAQCGCIGALALDGAATVLCLGIVRPEKPAGRALCAAVRAVVRGGCLLCQLGLIVMIAMEAMHEHNPLWARLCALIVPAAAAAGNVLLLRAEKKLKAQEESGS